MVSLSPHLASTLDRGNNLLNRHVQQLSGDAELWDILECVAQLLDAGETERGRRMLTRLLREPFAELPMGFHATRACENSAQ